MTAAYRARGRSPRNTRDQRPASLMRAMLRRTGAPAPRRLDRQPCGPGQTRAMAATTHRRIDRRRVKELTEREEARLNERTPASRAMFERARRVLSDGVASSYQLRDPWPIYLERGDGPRVWD